MARWKVNHVCTVCKKDFLASRADAKFCSQNCRKAHNRVGEKIERRVGQIKDMIQEVYRLGGKDELLKMLAELEV